MSSEMFNFTGGRERGREGAGVGEGERLNPTFNYYKMAFNVNKGK
jgi:hypothetical protein